MAYKKKGTRKTKAKGTSLTKKVRQIEKKLYREAPERKVLSVLPSSLTGGSSTNINYLLMNGMIQGTGEGQRVGEQANFNYLTISFNPLSAATQFNVTMRVFIFIDKHPEGTQTGQNDLFYWATNIYPETQYNYQNRNFNRFKIIYDKTLTLGPSTGSINGTATSTVYNMARSNETTWTVKKKLNLKTYYSRGNAGTIADIDSGALYVGYFIDSATNTNAGLALAYNLFYTDA